MVCAMTNRFSRERGRRGQSEDACQEDVLEYLEMPYCMTVNVCLSISSEAAQGDDGHRASTLVLIREE